MVIHGVFHLHFSPTPMESRMARRNSTCYVSQQSLKKKSQNFFEIFHIFEIFLLLKKKLVKLRFFVTLFSRLVHFVKVGRTQERQPIHYPI